MPGPRESRRSQCGGSERRSGLAERRRRPHAGRRGVLGRHVPRPGQPRGTGHQGRGGSRPGRGHRLAVPFDSIPQGERSHRVVACEAGAELSAPRLPSPFRGRSEGGVRAGGHPVHRRRRRPSGAQPAAGQEVQGFRFAAKQEGTRPIWPPTSWATCACWRWATCPRSRVSEKPRWPGSWRTTLTASPSRIWTRSPLTSTCTTGPCAGSMRRRISFRRETREEAFSFLVSPRNKRDRAGWPG